MASVTDIIVIVVLLFGTGIALLFSVMVSHTVNTNLINQTNIANNTAAVNVIQKADTALNYTDYMYMAGFIGLFIAIIIFGYIVGGEPVFAPIYFFLIILFAFVSIILQWVYNEVADTTALTTTIAVMPITNFILSHLGYFVCIMGFIGLIAMYAKPQGGGY